MFENSRRVSVLLFVLYAFVILLDLDDGETLLAVGWTISGGPTALRSLVAETRADGRVSFSRRSLPDELSIDHTRSYCAAHQR
ncbi:hypothetical protein [Halococcus agarilyticus]|uniref:hypothetical protein n=1 Tax=Halococcus agarilyticus TaxID=1232219 RepID=UPI00067815AA|nr:hypothetical protein [Halococcus agarilyticus]